MELDKFAPEGDEDEQAMRIKLLIFRIKNKKLLEMDSFLPPQTYLESWQTTDFGKRKLETLGDDYAPLTAQTTIKKIVLTHFNIILRRARSFPQDMRYWRLKRKKLGIKTCRNKNVTSL